MCVLRSQANTKYDNTFLVSDKGNLIICEDINMKNTPLSKE